MPFAWRILKAAISNADALCADEALFEPYALPERVLDYRIWLASE